MALIIFTSGCSSKKIMEDDNARFSDINEEFAQVVQIDSPVTEKPESPKVAAKPKKTESGKKMNLEKKKTAEKKKVTEVAKKREPPTEDAENFVGRRPLVDPFREGEVATYAVSYFNMEAGEAKLSVEPFKIVNHRKVYHYKVQVKSSSMFSRFYAVQNSAETYVDYETLLPITFSINVRESSRLKEARMYVDPKTNEATYWETLIKKGEDEKKKKKQWIVNPFAQNIISAIFYLRNFTLYAGKQLAFFVSDDGKNLTFRGEVIREEKLKTEIGEVDTVVVKVSFEMDGQFKPTGDNLIWMTKDSSKTIVRIESKVKIGKIVAKIKSKS